MTVKELADKLGTYKPMITRLATKCGIVLQKQNGVLQVTNAQAEAISSQFAKHTKHNSNKTEPETNKDIVAALLRQLEVKDEQIRTQAAQLDTLTRLLDQQQRLQAATTVQIPEHAESRKNLFQRIFDRKEKE